MNSLIGGTHRNPFTEKVNNKPINMNISAYNHPIYRNFVRPELCEMLQQYGISSDTTHVWKHRNNEIILYTNIFDVDQYYSSCTKMIDQIGDAVRIVPAYTTADMMMLFAELGINWNVNSEFGKIYFAPIKSRFKDVVMNTSGERLPDVFARALLKLLSRRHMEIDVNVLNRVFSLVNYDTCG